MEKVAKKCVLLLVIKKTVKSKQSSNRQKNAQSNRPICSPCRAGDGDQANKSVDGSQYR
jgi:hypothetical protein